MQKILDVSSIGTTIHKARKAQRITQEQLSATCGVGVRFIRELEQGKETCEIGKVLIVLKMLGIDVYLVMRGEV